MPVSPQAARWKHCSTRKKRDWFGNLGITGHGWQAPATHLAALDRYPFETVMTSANLFMVQDDDFRRDWEALLDRCKRDDVGVHLLKATAKTSWGDRPHEYTTWYEPFTAVEDVNRAVSWASNQPITTMCSAGDQSLFETICDAAERYDAIDEAAQRTLLRQSVRLRGYLRRGVISRRALRAR